MHGVIMANKPTIPRKSQTVLNFSKANRQQLSNKQCSIKDEVEQNISLFTSKCFEECSIAEQSKKPIPKPRKKRLVNNKPSAPPKPILTTPECSVRPETRATGKGPIPLPRSRTPVESEDTNAAVYDDIVPAASKQCSIPENVYEDAASCPLEGLYDEASSTKYSQTLEQTTSDYNETFHMLHNTKESFPVPSTMDNRGAPYINITTPLDYIYPQASSKPLNSMDSPGSGYLNTDREYDYAYSPIQYPPSPCNTEHKYYYIDTLNTHSYETIPDQLTLPAANKPLPVPQCDQLTSLGGNYVNTQTPSSLFDMPHQMRGRTQPLTCGPNKDKLQSSLRKRKCNKIRPSIFDSSLMCKSGIINTETESNYDTIRSTQADLDRLLEANGVYFSPSARRHSLSSSESQHELLTLSMSTRINAPHSNEFDKLNDMVYTELREYRDAGIVHVHSRQQLAQDIQNITQCTPLSPPSLPTRSLTQNSGSV